MYQPEHSTSRIPIFEEGDEGVYFAPTPAQIQEVLKGLLAEATRQHNHHEDLSSVLVALKKKLEELEIAFLSQRRHTVGGEKDLAALLSLLSQPLPRERELARKTFGTLRRYLGSSMLSEDWAVIANQAAHLYDLCYVAEDGFLKATPSLRPPDQILAEFCTASEVLGEDFVLITRKALERSAPNLSKASDKLEVVTFAFRSPEVFLTPAYAPAKEPVNFGRFQTTAVLFVDETSVNMYADNVLPITKNPLFCKRSRCRGYSCYHPHTRISGEMCRGDIQTAYRSMVVSLNLMTAYDLSTSNLMDWLPNHYANVDEFVTFPAICELCGTKIKNINSDKGEKWAQTPVAEPPIMHVCPSCYTTASSLVYDPFNTAKYGRICTQGIIEFRKKPEYPTFMEQRNVESKKTKESGKGETEGGVATGSTVPAVEPATIPATRVITDEDLRVLERLNITGIFATDFAATTARGG